jgi:hypothetical protein
MSAQVLDSANPFSLGRPGQPVVPKEQAIGPDLRSTRWDFPVSSPVLVTVVLLVALCGFWFGERIEINGGLGWDGAYYSQAVKDLYGFLFASGINEYHVGRVLPHAIFHYVLRLFSVPRTDANIICTFGIANVVLLTLAAAAWCRVAGELQISQRGKWLGAAGMFLSFGVLKWLPYDPVLTDGFAPALGMLMLYFYLIDNRIALALVTAVGAFILPTLLYQGALLLVFPRRQCETLGRSSPRYALNTVMAAAIGLSVFAYLVYRVRSGEYGFPTASLAQYCREHLPLMQRFGLVAVVAAGCVSVYLFLALKFLWNGGTVLVPAAWIKSFRPTGALLALLLVVGTKAVVRRIATAPAPGSTGVVDTLVLFGWEAIRWPGVFLVAHIVFLGPIVILAVLRWKLVCQSLEPYGLGLTLCVTFNVLLSVDAESRHLLVFLPLLVPFIVKAVEDVELRLHHYAVLAVIVVLFSKIWLEMGGTPNADQAGLFPSQRLFMNLGPWMSRDMYYIQAGACLLAGGLLYALLRGQGSSHGRVRRGNIDAIRRD